MCINPAEGEYGPLIEDAKHLGYNMVGLNHAEGSGELDIVNRVDINPKNQRNLRQQLKRLRYKVEIIVVHCNTKSVSRQAARDNRIDLIRFKVDESRNHLFNRRQAGLMRDSGVGYEICLQDLLIDNRVLLVKRIKTIKKRVNIAIKYNLPIVVSSYAENRYDLRTPLGMLSLMSLVDVDPDEALNMVSSTPLGLVKKNRAKLGPKYVMPGVWLMDP